MTMSETVRQEKCETTSFLLWLKEHKDLVLFMRLFSCMGQMFYLENFTSILSYIITVFVSIVFDSI